MEKLKSDERHEVRVVPPHDLSRPGSPKLPARRCTAGQLAHPVHDTACSRRSKKKKDEEGRRTIKKKKKEEEER